MGVLVVVSLTKSANVQKLIQICVLVLTVAQIDKIVDIIQNPLKYGIPKWFLNRQKNITDNAYTQLFANNLDMALREDLTRLRKIRAHRGIRHYFGLTVRGQHTKTPGRRGKTVGVARKK